MQALSRSWVPLVLELFGSVRHWALDLTVYSPLASRHLPWVATQGISTHWIRHSVLTWVERNFGYAVAHAYAGHTGSGSEAGATATYVRASLSEVAAALAALTDEPHPLATTEGW